jgi:hypothetical protein
VSGLLVTDRRCEKGDVPHRGCAAEMEHCTSLNSGATCAGKGRRGPRRVGVRERLIPHAQAAQRETEVRPRSTGVLPIALVCIVMLQVTLKLVDNGFGFSSLQAMEVSRGLPSAGRQTMEGYCTAPTAPETAGIWRVSSFQ